MNFLKNYVGFSWRMNRAKFFWYSIMLIFVIWVGISLLGKTMPTNIFIIWIIFQVLAIYPNLSLTIKRFHDMNQNGIWFIPVYIIYLILYNIIPMYSEIYVLTYIFYAFVLINAVIGVMLIFVPGTIWENRYGKDLIARKGKNQEENKKKRTWWRILALSIPLVMVFWLLVSLVFYILWAITTDPTQAVQWATLFSVIQNVINRLLWILGLLSIPGTIIGIILLTKK